MEGKILGNYQILRKIGEGGMGTVYVARDVGLERDVAIKIISPELARNPGLMARFRVEAIAQARLNHSNIVTIHSFEQQKDTYYIVMEYVEGKTLKEIINERAKIPVKQALKIFSRLLEGIAYAHRKGVLHRDIKPANVFITTDEMVKIGDFGIAKVSGIDGLTRAGSTLGTPLYSSPEQIRGEKMGPETDIYSLGVTLYEMLTGVQPFKTGSGSDFEIQQAHLEKTTGKPSLLNSAVPSDLDAIVMKSLAKSPSERFRNTEAFKKAVEALKGETAPAEESKEGRKKVKSPAVDFFWLKTLKNVYFKATLVNRLKGIKNVGKNVGNRLKISGGIDSLKISQKKKLLIILIPLLILLLLVIAYSDNGNNYNIKNIMKKNEKISRRLMRKGGINENKTMGISCNFYWFYKHVLLLFLGRKTDGRADDRIPDPPSGGTGLQRYVCENSIEKRANL
jgi:serine/threonine-protein kinase